jgi:hypothetical protein
VDGQANSIEIEDNATVKVRSKLGVETVFRIFFPLKASTPESVAGHHS